MPEGIWLELVLLGALVWLGYIGARLVGRFNLPSVTGFLLVGIALGPYGLGLLDLELLHKIQFVNTLALGLIVFLIGEELTGRMLRRHHWSFWVTAVLTITLPALLVGWSLGWLRPDEPRLAWVLGAIAVSGAPATVMSVLAESRARGRACETLLGTTAFADIATVVLYSTVGPLLLFIEGDFGSLAETGLGEARLILGGVALGLAFGWVLAMLLRRAQGQGELLSLGLTHVLLVVATAQIIGVSPLLAPLVMGIVVAVYEEGQGDRGRCFNALRTVEYPVYIIFFTLAGAELNVVSVLEGGGLMLAYILARSLGKFGAGYIGSVLGGLSQRQAAWFGLGSLPQAGVAVGLALSASADYPEIGGTITAVVLASIVFFEAAGPLAVKRATQELSCDLEGEQAEEEGPACRERTVLVPVSHHWSAEKLLHVLEATEDENDCPSTFVLSTVITPARRYTPAQALARGQRMLEELAEVARGAGHHVETRITQGRLVEESIALLAQAVDADLVVLGAPSARARSLIPPVGRTPLHRILDRLTVPVFLVPADWHPRVSGTMVSATEHAEEGSAAGPQAEDDSTVEQSAEEEPCDLEREIPPTDLEDRERP